jgi:PKD repeat protein
MTTMGVRRRTGLAASAAAAVVLMSPSAALADVPPNDDFTNATTISALPFTDTVDATALTREAGEPTACQYSGSIGTAWYAFTSTQTESITASVSGDYPMVAAYTGTSLADLRLLDCRGYWNPLTIRADAGQTYYFQVGPEYDWAAVGSIQFSLDRAPAPVPDFGYDPADPSSFDTVQFYDRSYDPGGAGFVSEAWQFGDGATGTGQYTSHRYSADGDYTVQLTVTTTDGRTASTSGVLHVRTHDVAITRLSAPASANANQTRQISLEVRNTRYPETVTVELDKSVPGGFQQVGYLTQYVPARSSGQTTSYTFNYTFTADDAAIGKVTFKAVANIVGARDALPADNEAIASPTKVTR